MLPKSEPLTAISSTLMWAEAMADVSGAEVHHLEVGNSACLGAALRAWHADELADGRPMPWEDVVVGFAEPAASSIIQPVPSSVEIYRRLRSPYAAREAQALSEIGSPRHRTNSSR